MLVTLAAILGGCFLDAIGVDGDQTSSGGGGGSGPSGGSGDGGATGGDPSSGAGGGGHGGAPAGGAGEGGAGGEGTVTPWWDPAFARRVKITFDNQASAEALVDFPVMIRLDPVRFEYAAALAGGDDVRFVDAGGSALAFEIERWTEDGESWLWLRVPQIDAGSTTDHVYLYYANPMASPAQSPGQVWSGTHLAVYHLADDPGGTVVRDSSNANNDGEPLNMSSNDLIAGRVGDGFDFDGNNDYVALGGDHVAAFEIEPGEASTIEAWMRSTTADRQLLTDEASCAGWGIELNAAGELSGRLFLDSNAGCPAAEVYILDSPSAGYADGMWHHVALVIDRPGGVMRLHVDGSLVATHAAEIDNALAGGGFYDRIGTNFNNTRPFEGSIDEVRIASVARSTAWIAAQHASMIDGLATFASTEIGP